MLSTREPQVGGGPGGGAGQVHQEPHEEFAGPDLTHTMSGLEIGLMVGIVLVFATLIGSLFWYRVRKMKKMQVDEEAGNRPRTQDGDDAASCDEMKRGAPVPSGSFRQLFGRNWFAAEDDAHQEKEVPLERV